MIERLKVSLLSVILLLNGCHREADRADAAYGEAVDRAASPAELCKLASDAATAWKIVGDDETYKRRSEIAKLECINKDMCSVIIGGCPSGAARP